MSHCSLADVGMGWGGGGGGGGGGAPLQFLMWYSNITGRNFGFTWV